MGNLKNSFEEAKVQAYIMRIATILISSSIPVVLGLNLVFSSESALILGGISTALIGLDQYFNVTTRDKRIKLMLKRVTKLSLDIRLYTEGNTFVSDDAWFSFKERFDEVSSEMINSHRVNLEEASVGNESNSTD